MAPYNTSVLRRRGSPLFRGDDQGLVDPSKFLIPPRITVETSTKEHKDGR